MYYIFKHGRFLNGKRVHEAYSRIILGLPGKFLYQNPSRDTGPLHTGTTANPYSCLFNLQMWYLLVALWLFSM
jgi:hypothetical protein